MSIVNRGHQFVRLSSSSHLYLNFASQRTSASLFLSHSRVRSPFPANRRVQTDVV